jgi:quercetin dioxygenase-like cupin family protein
LATPGDELHNPFTGQSITFVEVQPDVLVLESSYRAGGPPAPSHLHPAQDERFEVLSGAVRAVVGSQERILRAGDTLTVPAGTPHEFGGAADEDGSVRWEIRPPLRTAEFLETAFGLANGTVPAGDGPGLLEEFAAEFRLTSDEG